MKNKTIVLAILVALLMAMSSCGGKPYVGTWYNMDDPDSSSLIITKDNTYSWGSEGGSVSETDEGILLIEQSGLGGTEIFTLSSYDGDTALISEDGDWYIQDYEAAYEYHAEQIEEKISNQYEQLIGHWSDIDSYFDLNIYEDGTYELSSYDILYNKGAPETGTWTTSQDGDYLDVFLEPTDSDVSRIGNELFVLEDGVLKPFNYQFKLIRQ